MFSPCYVLRHQVTPTCAVYAGSETTVIAQRTIGDTFGANLDEQNLIWFSQCMRLLVGGAGSAERRSAWSNVATGLRDHVAQETSV